MLQSPSGTGKTTFIRGCAARDTISNARSDFERDLPDVTVDLLVQVTIRGIGEREVCLPIATPPTGPQYHFFDHKCSFIRLPY